MADSKRAVTVVAKLLNGSKVEKETKDVAEGFTKLGDSTRKADEEAGKASHGWGLFSKNVKSAGDESKKTHETFGNLAKGAVGFLAGYVGVGAIKQVVNQYGEAAEAAEKFHAATGMSSQSAVDTNAIFKSMGISGGERAFTLLAKNQQTAERQWYTYGVAQAKAAEKGKPMTTLLGTQATAFKELGINMGSFKGLSLDQKFELITERLSGMKSATDKARIAQQLFGRGGKELLPLFNQSELGWKALTKDAREYMPTLGIEGPKALEKYRIAQVKSKMATEGLELTLGMKLAPVLTKVTGGAAKLALAIEHQHGIWKVVDEIISTTVHTVKSVVEWFKHSKTATDALGVALGVLAGVWAVEKIASFAKWLRAAWIIETLFTGETTLMSVAATIATFAISGLGLAVIAATAGVALLALGAYMLITHWKDVEKFFVGLWDWIKGHWKLLLPILAGPFGLAVLFIVEHFNTIVGFVKSLPKKIESAGRGMWDWIKNAFKSAIDWVIEAWNKVTGLLAIPAIHVNLPIVGDVGYGGSGRLVPKIPLLAEGGSIWRPGSVIVGESGPEMLSLPAGAGVSPLGGGAPAFAGGGDLIVAIEIDRQELGRVVVNDFRSLEARRS